MVHQALFYYPLLSKELNYHFGTQSLVIFNLQYESRERRCLGNDKYFLWKHLQQFCFSSSHGKVPLKQQYLKKVPMLFCIFNVWKIVFCCGTISEEVLLKNLLQLFVPFHFKTKKILTSFCSSDLITEVRSALKFYAGCVLYVNMIIK